jgi:hypothetical protein
MPKDWVISENQAPNFSKNGKQLYFGVAPKPIAKDTALIANDHAILDVWSYKDDYLKTIQLKNLNKDLKNLTMPFFRPKNPNYLLHFLILKWILLPLLMREMLHFLSEFLIMIPEPNRNGQAQKRKLLYRKQFNG